MKRVPFFKNFFLILMLLLLNSKLLWADDRQDLFSLRDYRRRNTRIPFNVNEVIEQDLRHYSSHSERSCPKCIKQPNFELTNGEFLIDTSIVYGPALYNQLYPAVCFDGTNYLLYGKMNVPLIPEYMVQE